ncbi:MAG: hypothetical protein QW332_05555 [Thermoproteota archaeon]
MQEFPSGGRSIKRAVRKRTATIVEHEKGPRGGETRYRFPIPDKAHARNALARLPVAKGLSSEERAKIRARAYQVLYGSSKKPSEAELREKVLKQRAQAA